VFAIIHTESYFNPKARSPAPAYGLMQLVPTSGARDAYNFVYKKDMVVSPNYLYDPVNNIRLGCAYFRVLLSRYFNDIDHLDSRYFCAISAYNTGAGNVSKAIVGRPKLKPAIREVNKMTPEEVLKKLKRDLPYQETRDYIVRVLERMRYYEEWG
jgi:membrane-bound lytic murein transglycosylase C